jgi:hypothetical protein
MIVLILVVAVVVICAAFLISRSKSNEKAIVEQSLTARANVPYAKANAASQFAHSVVRAQDRNINQSFSIVKATINQGHAYARTPEERTRVQPITEAYLAETAALIDDVNHMRAAPLLRSAGDRYLAKVKEAMTTEPIPGLEALLQYRGIPGLIAPPIGDVDTETWARIAAEVRALRLTLATLKE